jgi:hypothetical protein
MAVARWLSMKSMREARPLAPVRVNAYVGERKKPSKRSMRSCSSGPRKTAPSRLTTTLPVARARSSVWS